jgi:hypothetical protein
MWLTNLLIEHKITEAGKEELISGISTFAHGLDDIVKDLNKILEKKINEHTNGMP